MESSFGFMAVILKIKVNKRADKKACVWKRERENPR